MYRGFSSPEKPATGSQRGVEKDGARERPGKEVHRKPENTRLPLASPETGLSQEPPETLADDGIDLLWGAEGGQSRSGPRTEHCGPRSDQPPVNRNPGQRVRPRSLIVRYPGGFSAVTSRPPASHAIRTSVGSALPAHVRVGGLDSDSSPHSMSRRVSKRTGQSHLPGKSTAKKGEFHHRNGLGLQAVCFPLRLCGGCPVSKCNRPVEAATVVPCDKR